MNPGRRGNGASCLAPGRREQDRFSALPGYASRDPPDRAVIPPAMKIPLLPALAFLATLSAAQAAPKLNGFFGDGMLLQRDLPVSVWGTAAPGEELTVSFAGQRVSTTTGADGRWLAKLAPLPASAESRDLVVEGNGTATVRDVLVGDLWLCSGQSNMAFALDSLKTHPKYGADLAAANFPAIRQGLVKREGSLEPLRDAQVSWAPATAARVGPFTAVGFYFARDLHRELGVPIGLVLAAWGGTSINPWISYDALAADPALKESADRQIADFKAFGPRAEAFPGDLAAWEKRTGREDAGPADLAPAQPATDVSAWPVFKPGMKWRQAGLPNGGVAWLRKDLEVPAELAGKPVRLDLGSISEQDLRVYFNGTPVFANSRKPPGFYSGYQNFTVPGDLVTAGHNVIAFRYRTSTGDTAPSGKSVRDSGLIHFQPTGLNDEWRVFIEREFSPLAAEDLKSMPKIPPGSSLSGTSSGLYGGMIHPLTPAPLKGVLWYQGEADGSRGVAYRALLPTLIKDWRARWGQPNLPFLIQQLPNWAAGGAQTTGWAELREAQALTAARIPGVFLSVAYDLGESGNVHPANKRDVGARLARVALANVYGRDIAWRGPVRTKSEPQGSAYRVTFESTGTLRTRDGTAKPGGFQLAGADQKFFPAVAEIDGTSVVLTSREVPAPVAARYAFINDPVEANLTDATGLPAAPFRTDDWPVSSSNRK